MPEFLNSMIERIPASASVKCVYGDPVSANGITIVPVARIAYGLGGGSGAHARPGKLPDRPETGHSEGGGGGGGVAVWPVGVFEISAKGTRFIPANDRRKLMAAALAGLCLGLLVCRTKRLLR